MSNETLDVEQIAYASHPEINQSDHKPVSAEFLVKVNPSGCDLHLD
jgi:hypothetical protein